MSNSAQVEKIRKLLAQSVANGATEDEAHTAMQLAAAMAVKYGIDISKVGEKTSEKVGHEFTQEKLNKWEIYCLQAAAELYGCKAGPSNGSFAWWAGKPSDIEMAKEMAQYLIAQVERIYKVHLGFKGGLSQPERAKFRRDFKEGCGIRIFSRARQIILDMSLNDDLAKSTGSTALVVKGYFDQKSKDIADYFGSIKTSKSRTRTVARKSSAFYEGVQAGDQVRLRTAVDKG